MVRYPMGRFIKLVNIASLLLITKRNYLSFILNLNFMAIFFALSKI
jgi:hypothetical protein